MGFRVQFARALSSQPSTTLKKYHILTTARLELRVHPKGDALTLAIVLGSLRETP